MHNRLPFKHNFRICLEDHQALTPPMGFSTWNEFGCTISEETLVNTGHLMIKKHPADWEGKERSLKDAGYTYVNIDDCWHAKNRDSQGNPQWDTIKFPKGLKWLADTLHQMGLKIGIYSCAGTATCCNYFAAFDPSHPEVGYDLKDANAYADWGIDYLKEDWCSVPSDYQNASGSQKLYTRMRDALKAATSKTSRPIVFSLCNWGMFNVSQWGDTIGHLWRTGSDISPEWTSIITNITINAAGAQYAKPGAWNDPDMMEVGNGTLSLSENRAHFDLWCISAAPLILGNDLSKMSDSIFAILTNREVIAVDQDSLGYQGRKVRTDGEVQIWSKKLKNGAWSVVLVNNSNASAGSSVKWSDIGESDLTKSYPVRDLWQHKIVSQSATGSYAVNNIPGHSTVHLVFGKAYWMEPVSIHSNISIKSSPETFGNNIQIKKIEKTTAIYIPFASSYVKMYDLQGKRMNSFLVNGPSWITLPNSPTKGKMCIMQIITNSGKKV
ncbi:MAG TPA: glycoside hydrolase family 27 protein, partial [Chitinispirillaceae bacterium]|nr:glycoside hydrolase family 27 protein [Chitinispirillaceae bacterium]